MPARTRAGNAFRRFSAVFGSEPAGTRTQDPRIKSPRRNVHQRSLAFDFT